MYKREVYIIEEAVAALCFLLRLGLLHLGGNWLRLFLLHFLLKPLHVFII